MILEEVEMEELSDSLASDYTLESSLIRLIRLCLAL